MHISKQTIGTLILSLISAVICGFVVAVQSDLLYYVPGPVFGLLFSIVNLTKPFRVVIFVVASSVIYVIAWNIFFAIADSQLLISSWEFAAFLAGLFGALALALSIKFLTGTLIKAQDEARTIVLGAIAGIGFIELIIWGIDTATFTWPVSFAVWQVSVGWSLTTSIQKEVESQVAQPAKPMNYR